MPSPVIATSLPPSCSLLDQRHLVLGRGLGEEVVDAGLVGNRLGGQRVVAGDHHRADAHPAHLVEAFAHALLDDVLEVDDAEHRGRCRRATWPTTSGVPPAAEMPSTMSPSSVGHGAALAADPVGDRAGRALAQLMAVLQIDTGHPGGGGELDPVRAGQLARRAGAQPVLLLGEHHDRAALRGLVGEAGQLRGVGQLLGGDPGERDEVRRLPVAQGDGAGLVQQQGVDVAGGLDRAAGHGQHVALHQAVHAGDADGRQQRADRGRDQADQQRDHHDAGDAVAGERQRVRDAGVVGLGVDRQRLQGRDGEHEDDRQRGQQDVQRDLVGRLLPVGALDEGDHPVDEALARLLGDLHDDAVGQHGGAAGDRRAVAAGLADDRCGLAGDGRLVHRGNAFDDVAVAGDDLAGLDDDDVALLQQRRGDLLLGGRCCRAPSR